MTRFTELNSDWSGDVLEIVNWAYDEAWGALKYYYARRDDQPDYDQIKQSLADAINNAWVDGIECSDLCDNALRALGLTPVRSDLHPLECV